MAKVRIIFMIVYASNTSVPHLSLKFPNLNLLGIQTAVLPVLTHLSPGHPAGVVDGPHDPVAGLRLLHRHVLLHHLMVMVRMVWSHYCTLGTGWRSSWKIQSGRWPGRRLAEQSEVGVVLGEEVVGELRPALQPGAGREGAFGWQAGVEVSQDDVLLVQ